MDPRGSHNDLEKLMPIYAANRVDPKDPDAVMFYRFDVTNSLNSGATVSSATWSAPGLTAASVATTSTTTSAKLSGGNDGEDYAVQATVVTSDGETLVLGGMLKVRKATSPRIG